MTITYEVTKQDLDLRYTAVVRGEMPAAEMSTWLPTAYYAVLAYLRRIGAAATGAPFARFTFLGDTVAVEAGVPVRGEVPGDGEVEPSALPDGPALVTTHVGGYEELGTALGHLTAWAADHGLEPAGPHWEVYLTDPNAEPDPTTWRTQLVLPIRGAHA